MCSDVPDFTACEPATIMDKSPASSQVSRGVVAKVRIVIDINGLEGKLTTYPLVNVYITMERSTMFKMGKSTISMAISNSYVSLPEGKPWLYHDA